MIPLRWLNNRLQQQDDALDWHDVPVVKDPEHPPAMQCAACGELYVNDHECWV